MATITPTRSTVTNGDAELYVEQRGAGPDLLLLCGLTDTVEVWEAQAEPLADRFRVTVFDNRGVGRTRAPVESISVASHTDDAAAVIEALGLDTPHVMGFSGGGVMAQELAITRPELVRSLVLCDTFCEADELMRRKGEIWMRLAETAESPEQFMREFLTWVYSREAHEDGRVDRWIAEALAFPYPMSDEAFMITAEAYTTHTTKDRLHRIDVPTLVIASGEDAACPPSTVQKVADGIAGAELVLIPGVGHQPFHEVPEEYNAIVTGFWERISS